jgi:DNA-directed RNA polymerase specialized sigma24 family protein
MRMERSEGIAVTGSASSWRLAELYERHVGRAVALAALVGGDADAAEDIAHEAFIRTAGRLAGLRDPSAFDIYLRRTVVNLCRARARRALIERATRDGWLRATTRLTSRIPRTETSCGAPFASSLIGSAAPWCFVTTRTCPRSRWQMRCGAHRGR